MNAPENNALQPNEQTLTPAQALAELVDNSRVQNRRSKLTLVLVIVCALMLAVLLAISVYSLTVILPPINDLISQLSTLSETLSPEDMTAMLNAIKSMDVETINSMMDTLNSVDFEALSIAIDNLNTVVSPLVKFFG